MMSPSSLKSLVGGYTYLHCCKHVDLVRLLYRECSGELDQFSILRVRFDNEVGAEDGLSSKSVTRNLPIFRGF
jgi:hypothetical protein